MSEYSINKVDESLNRIKENVQSMPNFAETRIAERMAKYQGSSDYIAKYDSLIGVFGYCGRCHLIANNDATMFFWTIVYQDEKKMNNLLEKHIKRLRRQAKSFPAVYFEDFGLAIIKLAKERA